MKCSVVIPKAKDQVLSFSCGLVFVRFTETLCVSVYVPDMGKESIPEKKVSRTPRLTKRMAARLDGKTSDTDTSKSNADRCVLHVAAVVYTTNV